MRWPILHRIIMSRKFEIADDRPFSSVVERKSCKLEVCSSILQRGMLLHARRDEVQRPCSRLFFLQEGNIESIYTEHE